MHRLKISWDPSKAEKNFRKHRIRFSDAELVLCDPFALTVEDHDVCGEQRYVSVGCDATGRIVVVVYTYRRHTVRLISARRATATERRQYEKRIQF